jgi:hypothetical protein
MSGRAMLVLAAFGFFAVAMSVISRRTYGIERQRRAEALAATRDSLTAVISKMETSIREASSRARLLPMVEERLKMRVPRPEQQITLPRPRRLSLPDSGRQQ